VDVSFDRREVREERFAATLAELDVLPEIQRSGLYGCCLSFGNIANSGMHRFACDEDDAGRERNGEGPGHPSIAPRGVQDHGLDPLHFHHVECQIDVGLNHNIRAVRIHRMKGTVRNIEGHFLP